MKAFHPTTPERLGAMDATIMEIEGKKTAEQPLEHFPTGLNHLTGMILGRGQARFAWRCGAVGKEAQRRHGAKTPGLRWSGSIGPESALVPGL
jgi:hypothetical protein